MCSQSHPLDQRRLLQRHNNPPDTQTGKSGLYSSSARALLLSDLWPHQLPHNPTKDKVADLHQNHAECVSAGAVNTLEGFELEALVRICDHHGSPSTWVSGSTCTGSPVGRITRLWFFSISLFRIFFFVQGLNSLTYKHQRGGILWQSVC